MEKMKCEISMVYSLQFFIYLLLALTLKGHTSVKLHKEHTGCLTPKGNLMCAVLTVLDISLQKNYWTNIVLSIHFKDKKVS